MHRWILLPLAWCCLALTVHGQRLQHAELLGRPTDDEITVHVIFDERAEVCVEYGRVDGAINAATSWQIAEPLIPVVIRIEGLVADTKYRYQLCHRLPGSEEITRRAERMFHTARKPGSEFTFVVQADPHVDEQSDTSLYRRCLQNQLEDQPDFMIDLGDIFMSDKLKGPSGRIERDTIRYRCDLLRTLYEPTVHSVPLFIALGNHEGEAGWQLNGTADNVAVWGTLERKHYYCNPEPNRFYSGDTTSYPFVGRRQAYYAWTWGDATFIVLDPYWHTRPKPDSLTGWRWTLGKEQYDWLRHTLENKRTTFTFVFAHQLIGGDPDGRGGVEFADLYEWGGNGLNGEREFEQERAGWEMPIKDLLTQHRVNIFFHGHDHFYGQQEKDCLIYQETPQPSHPNFQTAGQAQRYGYLSGVILPNAGHLRINVNPDRVRVEYVRAYTAANETATRKNKDVSATYIIGARNCYDSVSTGVPVLWNADYADELVYPNPTWGETTIEFSIDAPTRTSCRIFDASGRLIRTLFDEQILEAGRYQIVWDGLDANRQPATSGIYRYSMNTANGPINGQIVLQR
ncbi:MAG: metallophosphoesterase [Candidatus Kapaibacteriota bacterium]